MRKIIQNQILDVFETMKEGLGYAGRASAEEAFEILNSCYTSAFSIIATLEEHLPEDAHEVYSQLFGIYISLLEKANDLLQQGSDYTGVIDELLLQLNQLQRTVSAEKATIQVVFFPYKASMWDSMESVWKAACADARCEVFVVPVPYYEKKGSGSVARTYYEGDQYPQDVPIVNYKEYDLAAHQPDIAYIHNPYDSYNHVTTLASKYHSHQLKKHVGTLVYIPYFVTPGPTEGAMVNIVSSNSADVIVTYNDADYHRFNASMPGKQIICTGSPKIDKLLQLDADKPALPQPWQERLAGKKVFLLNLSLNTLLQFNEGYLNILEDIFDYFQKRPEIALLWRPHPLLHSTIQSLRPKLLDRYEQLVQQFENGHFGVYDTSADLATAIALSDAYIGDSTSSVTLMFAITGKPAYTLLLAADARVTADCAIDDESKATELFAPLLWKNHVGTGLSVLNNTIYRYHAEENRTEPIQTIEADGNGSMLYLTAAKAGTYSVFAPYFGSTFLLLDERNHLVEIPYEFETADTPKFMGGVTYNGDAWFIGSRSGILAQCDGKTGKIIYHKKHLKALADILQGITPIFAERACLVEEYYHIPLVNLPLVVCFNLKNGTATFHPVGNRAEGYYNMVYDGQNFWLCPYTGFNTPEKSTELIRWNKKKSTVHLYNTLPANFALNENKRNYGNAYQFLLHWKGKILAFPCVANQILEVDAKSGAIAEYTLSLDFDFNQRKNSRFTHLANFTYIGQEDNLVYLVANYDFRILTLNLDTKEIRTAHCLSNTTGNAASSRYFQMEYLYMSDPLFPLDAFIQRACSGSIPARDKKQAAFYQSKLKNGSGGAGAAIHQQVMKGR